MSDYGYLHTARVVGQDEASGGWYVESVALARDRKWGPVPSCVAGLAPGDKVVLAATGTTRDNLLILGALDPRYPDLGDIPGLSAALAAKADQAALDAFEAATLASLDDIGDTNAAQDGRLTAVEGRATAIEGVDTAQDGRLTNVEGRATAIEGVNTTQDGRLTSVEGVNTTQNGRLGTLETYSQVFRDGQENDTYGDIVSPFPRLWTSGGRTLGSQIATIWRTRLRVGASLARIRAIVSIAGVGSGTVTAGLYTASSSAGPYTLVNNAANALTTVGLQAFVFGSPTVVPAGTYVLILLVRTGTYTTSPQIAALQNSTQQNGLNPSASVVWGTKAAIATPPASITVSDGTWTAEVAPWWVSAA
jgi:hypothetical protein